jgi:hypothetical protein
MSTILHNAGRKSWKTRLAQAVKRASRSRSVELYLRANCDAVAQVIRGLGPDDSNPRGGAGARIVFNIASTHIPSFCDASQGDDPKPYKNAYDLNKQSASRLAVDRAIELATKRNILAKDIYFAAVETTGAGIRFYGDMCLVLDHQPPMMSLSGVNRSHNGSSVPDVLILNRNSYDLIREPIVTRITKKKGTMFGAGAANELRSWLGSWSRDLREMAILKVLDYMPVAARRWTTGQVAESLLHDEDYIEVLYPESFGMTDLFEVRGTAADAAAEADIASREWTGESPSWHELEWRQQRREARRALARHGVRYRVVNTSGRLKGG